MLGVRFSWLAAAAALVGGVDARAETQSGQPPPPHVVFIVSDDLGWNDVSFHGSSQIPTPNLDALARSGVILSHYFVQPVCSPTRATFATGRHVIHTGVYDPMNGGSGDLSLNFSLWSNGFKKLGYTTAAIGKWHIGMSSWRFTPLERGFDTYYGYLGGGEDYWTHVDGHAIDLFDGREPVTNASCETSSDSCPERYYSATLFTDRASRVIHDAAASRHKLFLYLAYQSVHSPDEAPQYMIDAFNATVPNAHRRTFAGMVAALDVGVGSVADALRATGMFDNTVLVFSTDNGGPADGFNGNMACNWPLRGMKRTLFEGGVRGVGFVRGPGLPSGRFASGYVHAADWFHTLLRVGVFGANGTAPAGGSAPAVRALLPAGEPPFAPGDGVDVWDYLTGAAALSPRGEVLHEAHPAGSAEGNGNALRLGDLKVVVRTGGSWSTGSGIGSNDGWFGGPGSSDQASGAYCVSAGDAARLTVQCPPPPRNFTEGYACEGSNRSAPCLFNVTADPCEQVDLSASRPDLLAPILERLAAFQAAAVSTAAHANPDGGGCPYVAKVDGVSVWMPCDNNGSHPPSPGPPPPPGAFELTKADGGGGGGGALRCLSAGLELAACGPSSKVWSTGKDGGVGDALMTGGQCLKVFESASGLYRGGGCGAWTQLHVGVCRGDSNSFSLAHGELVSSMCAGRCAVARESGGVVLGPCEGSNATGWAEGGVCDE